MKLDHGVSLEEESAKAFHVDKGPCRHLVAPLCFLLFYPVSLFLLSVKASDGSVGVYLFESLISGFLFSAIFNDFVFVFEPTLMFYLYLSEAIM